MGGLSRWEFELLEIEQSKLKRLRRLKRNKEKEKKGTMILLA